VGVPIKVAVETPDHEAGTPLPDSGDSERKEAVRQELNRILASGFFRSAGRSRQFLEYVVQQKLEGHPDLLKERTIGTEVFHRPPGYATGDDPIVRVQAGEVRRRLEQYYQANEDCPVVSIELPVGSYSPTFHWAADKAVSVPAEVHPPIRPAIAQPEIHTQAQRPLRRSGRWIVATFCAALLLVMGAGLAVYQRSVHRTSVMDQFWNPVFATQQPVLICLAKPITYRPSQELYQRYERTHPGTFQAEWERTSKPLPLNPDEKLNWDDMYLASDYGVALGDAQAAVSLSGLLGKLGKASQVRIGTNYSFEDLRNSPAAVVGAFNNRWTMQITANLHFAFVETGEEFMIREQGGNGRTWKAIKDKKGNTTDDFAIVGRLLDSKTGQFTITVAGIEGSGTQAAGELVANPAYLADALRDAPADWEKMNVEMVVQTIVTDSVPGPARVVASHFW
jgi:hypothetical protein